MNGVAMKVFVSHIAEEAALATILKDWIESTFLGQADVFVSERDISSGEQWFRRLEEELTDAKVMLVLCSARSVSMPWINFETGAGHIKGIPIIPICYAGVTVDTLPVPLLFFQGLDAGAEDFGAKLISDLVKHLGYTRIPSIRHEEMSAKVKEALSQIGGESVHNAVEELGFVDHLVIFIEKTEALTNLVSEYGDSTGEIAIATSKFVDQADRAGNNQSSGTPQHLQRLARQFGKDLSVYAGKLEELNRKYGETLSEVKSSLQPILTYQGLEPSSGREDIDNFLVTLDQAEENVSDWKAALVGGREAIDGIPNYQRDMRRGARKVVEHLETLVSNLDDTLDMVQDAKATCNYRFGRGNLD